MEPVADTVAVKPLGQTFAEERERQGLTRTEAAQRLHMSAYQIEALEIGDYNRLPKGTFLRGFVRNYSKALGLDPNAMLLRLAQGTPNAPAPGIVVPSQNIRFDPLGERLSNPYVKAGVLAVVVVALLLAAVYWWLFIRPAPPGAPRKAPEKPAAVSPRSGPPQQIAAAPMAAPEPVRPTSAPVVAETPKVETPKAEAKKAELLKTEIAKAEAKKSRGQTPEKQQEAQNSRGQNSRGQSPERQQEAGTLTPRSAGARVLKFRFKGESWVEIRDGQGRMLMSRINAKGSEAEVEGRPPLTVIVGNASDVQVTYNERDFPLAPHTKVAVARFTVE